MIRPRSNPNCASRLNYDPPPREVGGEDEGVEEAGWLRQHPEAQLDKAPNVGAEDTMAFPFVSKAEFAAIKARIKAKKARRASKLAENNALGAVSSGIGASLGDPASKMPWAAKRVKSNLGHPSAKSKRRKKARKIKRGALKSQIVRLLGLLDAKKNGKACRIAEECPKFREVGPHEGDCAYHVWPAGSGDFVRLSSLAVVWACSSANYGEFRHRLLYRDKHEKIFGKERMELLRTMSYQIVKYPMSELLAMRENLQAELAR